MDAPTPEARDQEYARRMGHYVAPILPYLADPSVTEIYTNPSSGEVWLAAAAGREATGVTLTDVQIRAFLNTCAERQSEALGRGREHIHGQLPLAVFKGARLQGLIPRVVARPCFNLRLHAAVTITLADYVQARSMQPHEAAHLRAAVRNRLNVLIYGGMGSGKTTLLNAVLHAMAEDDPAEDFLILEDAREIQCMAPGARYLTETDDTDLRDLVKITKRLFPGRIVIGEVRDGAALDLMDAWTSGHPGGVGTVHASSAVGALRKMAHLARRASDTDHRSLVAEAIDLLVGIEQTSSGRRVRDLTCVEDRLDSTGGFVLHPIRSRQRRPFASQRRIRLQPSPRTVRPHVESIPSGSLPREPSDFGAMEGEGLVAMPGSHSRSHP